ncbi:MAG: fused MFS/spermidine synthase, partial [Planctomycetota bacterium]
MSRSKKDKNKKALKAGLVVHPAVKWVMLIYFCSGVCSLMDEVVWVRLLKLTLGNTAYASCIVVSMFMAGLALGALIMGRYSDQVQRPLRLYVILELCATVSALLLPLALRFADQAYRWFFLAYRPSGTELLLLQVIVSAMILLVPAMVMGSTFPLLGRYVTNLSSMVGRLVGRLYTLNMLGATLGCFLAGFIFIRIAGVMGTVYIAAGINMLVAFSGWILSRSGVHLGRKTIEPPTDDQYGSDIGKEATRTKSYVLMFAFFISGLISIGYELIWMRSIVIPLGGYTYVFSGVLTVYLLGNVIGAGIGSRLSKRLKYAGAGFGVSLSCLGLLGIAYVWWLSILHFKISSKVISFVFGGNLDTAGVVDIGSPLIYCTFLFLLPAIMMGIGFPLALQAWSNYRHKVGQSTGTVYGINTIGAVIGGIVTGFLLIPLLGIQISITVLGLLGIWLGLLMVQMYWSNIKVATRSVHFLIAAGLTVTAVVQPFDLFTSRIASTPDSETITVLEGVTTTVSVKKDSRGNLILYSDGVAIAGDGDDFHRSAQKVLGNLGVLLHTDANNILSIGFGCGETTASLAQHNPELIDCVEIAPEVVQTALEFFGHINLAENLGQYVNMKYLDGKNYLHLTDNRYDLIINGADIPAYSGSAPLFATEHFQNASDHLNPGGLFMTKLHLASISKSSFDSILGTFTETYPYVTIWFPTNQPTSFFYLVGSSKKQLFSPEYIDSALQKQGVRESVAYLNLDTSQDV